MEPLVWLNECAAAALQQITCNLARGGTEDDQVEADLHTSSRPLGSDTLQWSSITVMSRLQRCVLATSTTCSTTQPAATIIHSHSSPLPHKLHCLFPPSHETHLFHELCHTPPIAVTEDPVHWCMIKSYPTPTNVPLQLPTPLKCPLTHQPDVPHDPTKL